MKLQRQGPHVTIRPVRLSDYKEWKKAHLSTFPQKQNPWDFSVQKKSSELTLAVFRKHLRFDKENRAKDFFYDLGIFLKDGTYVGRVSIMDITRHVFQNAYLGYHIFNNHWGKGYGKEAAKLGIEVAFKDLELHRVEAGIEPGNRRSIRLAKSLGLRKEGLSPKRLRLGGKWVDLLIYAATSEEFGITWKRTKKDKRIDRGW